MKKTKSLLKELKPLLVDWLMESGYSKKHAKEQLDSAKIDASEFPKVVVTYDNGVKDVIKYEHGELTQIS